MICLLIDFKTYLLSISRLISNAVQFLSSYYTTDSRIALQHKINYTQGQSEKVRPLS